MKEQYDVLITKLAEARDELFEYDRMVESGMINGPEYVVDEMVTEIKRLRETMREIYFNCDSPRTVADLAEEALQNGD